MTTAIGLKFDVDNVSPVNNSEIWLTAQGKLGLGTPVPSGKFSIQTPSTWDDNTPIFEVKNKLGVPVLAVYNNGVRILVEDTDDKGVKGGFAIGGFDPTKAPGDETFNLMMVSPDSIRFTIDNRATKGVKGGFAIGSFDDSKATVKSTEFMNITPQSSNDGQFNTFIGNKAGKLNTTGAYNSFIGGMAGYNNTTGSYNTFIGLGAGSLNTTGSNNTAIGLGAGQSMKSGYNNIFIGKYSGYNELIIKDGTGNNNIFIGNSSGASYTNGYENVFIGTSSGFGITTGHDNVSIGNFSLNSNSAGNYNVSIGAYSGFKNTGNNNVFIGPYSGYNETGSNKLYIDNSSTSSPLIYGDFTDGSEKLIFNGNVGIGVSPGTKLSISGLTGSASGSTLVISGNNVYYLTSKRNSKENIEPLQDDFDKILKANPVAFKDKATGNPGIGYIAEDFEDAGLHNLIIYENGELVSLRYDLISVYSLEIIKKQQKLLEEQQQQFEAEKAKNSRLESEIETLKQRLSALEAVVGNK